ncbi:MAG: dihydroorotase [Defluviitaleaceae bacterium]|nr:dihydroorotase [Defluviitaleaceae bacterium]
MKTLIKGGRVICPATNTDKVKDIVVMGAEVAHAARNDGDYDRVIDASGMWVVPGLIDMHVHFRQPGQEHKEDMASGALSAVAGGFTTVCTMPNTSPPIDNDELIKFTHQRSAEIGLANILPICAITKGMKGEELTDIEAMVAAGAIGITEDGLTVRNAGVQLKAMEIAAKLNKLTFSHCEDMDLVSGGVMHLGTASQRLNLPGIHALAEEVIIARDILLAEHTGAALHVCHITTALGVQLVREAKARGVRVTAEVCPHHFTLCDEDILSDDSNFKMNPPLRSRGDVDAIIEGLRDGTIDVIATDHAPHHADEKAKGFVSAPFGIVGLETALGLSMEMVRKGILTPMGLVEAMSYAPAQILNINKGSLVDGAIADITIINPDAEWTVEPDKFASKARNTPFAGWALKGAAEYTIVGGRIVFKRR